MSAYKPNFMIVFMIELIPRDLQIQVNKRVRLTYKLMHAHSFAYFICDLRRSAANDKIFKLFFLHPFLASTIYNNTIKNKFDIGYRGFFRDTGF